MLDAILREIENRGYTQRQLVEILDEYINLRLAT
jgi:hypothetical protein